MWIEGFTIICLETLCRSAADENQNWPVINWQWSQGYDFNRFWEQWGNSKINFVGTLTWTSYYSMASSSLEYFALFYCSLAYAIHGHPRQNPNSSYSSFSVHIGGDLPSDTVPSSRAFRFSNIGFGFVSFLGGMQHFVLTQHCLVVGLANWGTASFIFSCDQAALEEAFSLPPSLPPSLSLSLTELIRINSLQ